jgi:dTDP-4-amino-4,6-dideoxygalactose transaminase
MSELQGAVAVAQLEKLQFSVDQRVAMAKLMTAALAGIPGIETPMITKGAEHTFWKYCLRVDPNVIQGGGPALAKVLATYGIASAPRYIQKPAFACQVFREQVTFGKSRFPFNLARPEAVNYDPVERALHEGARRLHREGRAGVVQAVHGSGKWLSHCDSV